MKYDKKAKEGWIHAILSALEPTFDKLNFKRASKEKYKKIRNGCECRYLFVDRYPRYSNDPHQLYINPCIHVSYRDLLKATCLVNGDKFNSRSATLGGSLGLYKDYGHSQEWPVDDEESAMAVVPQLEADIINVAVPFWDALDTKEKILEKVEINSIWAKRADSWKYRHVTLLYLERGIDAAMALVAEKPKKFWEIDHQTLKERLLSLP